MKHLHVNQWKISRTVVEWFKGIDNKKGLHLHEI